MLKGLDLKGAAQVALAGATVGTGMDAFHTFSGTTHYFHPLVLETAFWVPFLFATAYLLEAFTFAQLLPLDARRAPRSQALLCFAGFTAVYFATGFAPVSNAGKLAICVAAGIAGIAALRSKAALLTGLVAAIVGPGFEVFLTGIGGFEHLQPDFFRIPIWLPGLYFASGPGIGPLLSAWLKPEVTR
ncbi:MAG: hypothetical protein QM723_37940 [Myxococcaceae bacterium]